MANSSRWGQAELHPWDTCAPCALAQKPAYVCVCVCAARALVYIMRMFMCGPHGSKAPLRLQKGARVHVHACDLACVPTCTCAGTRMAAADTSTSVVGLNGCTVCPCVHTLSMSMALTRTFS